MHRSTLSILGVVTLAALAVAQEPPASDVAAVKFSTANVTGIVAEPTGLVGIGRDYKAWFTRGSVEFTPALGEAAPHNLPLQWTLHDVRRGDRVVHVADDAVAPQRDGSAVVFARAGLAERYDVRVEGIEQSFVFGERPAGAGDLVVRGSIVTELAPVVNGPNDIEWLRTGVGGVRVSKVVGIDADGGRAEGFLRLADGMLELVLPGAFVDAAHYPLVLDPLLGTATLLSGSHDGIEGDVGRSDNDHYFAAWTRRYSTSDLDVYGTFLDTAGVPVSNLVAFDTTTARARRPRVAGKTSHHAVAWEQASSLLTPRDVLCASVSFDYGTGIASRSSILTVAGSSDDEHDVAVGGNRCEDKVVVAYADSTGVHAQWVSNFGGNPQFYGSRLTVASGAGLGDVAISKEGCLATGGLWVVAWRFLGTLSYDIGARTIEGVTSTVTLSLVGAPVFPGSSILDEGHPAVDGQMLVWDRAESTLPNAPRDVVGVTLTVGVTGVSVVTPTFEVAGRSSVDESAPDIAYSYGPLRHWVVYVRGDGALGDDVLAALMNGYGTICGDEVLVGGIAGASVREGSPRIAAAYYTQIDTAQILITDSGNAPPFASQVVGQQVIGYGYHCPGEHEKYAAGCYSDSVYELHADAAIADAALQGNRLSLAPNAVGYTATWVPGGAAAWVAPVAAIDLPRSDDGQVLLDLTTAIGPGAALPTPNGPVTTLWVHSNGFVSTGPGNDGGAWNTPPLDYVPSPEFRNAPDTAFWAWHDWNPADLAGGPIRWHYAAGTNRLFVTWDGVENYSVPMSLANPGSFQFQFNLTTGQVDYVWLAVDGNTTSLRGSAHLVGYSPGGPSADAGPIAFSVAGGTSTIGGQSAMTLDASPDPHLLDTGISNPITYTVSNMPDFAPPAGLRVGFLFFSLAPLPGVDLGILGVPGCQANIASYDLSFQIAVLGPTTQSLVLIYPQPLTVGLSFYSQAIALMPPNSLPGGLNAFGMLTSNGLRTTF